MRRLIRKQVEFWDWSYAIDYGVIVAGGIALLLLNNFPYIEDSVPYYAVVLMALFCPLVAAAVFQFIYSISLHDLHHCALVILSGVGYAVLFTEGFKRFAGRPRPNWQEEINNDPDNARMSWPSGHTSTMFAGMTILALYLCGKSKLFQPHGGELWKALLFIGGPLTSGTLVAVSRTRDYHHNFDDVLAGAVIGCVIAMACYFCFYPSLFDANSHLPRHRRKKENIDTEL